WDSVSGGNQIQSIALRQSGGAPTNQIQSVTTGTTVTYTYDASGNVINDGSHSYAYDAEDRLISIDSGVTAQYAYDASNRRISKTAGGATTHYIWSGSQVLAEHEGSTGTVLQDYINAGGSFIAKVNSGGTSYFLRDRLSERVTLDGNGNVTGQQGHLPYGEDF